MTRWAKASLRAAVVASLRAALVASLWPLAAGSTEAPRLRFDPFARPDASEISRASASSDTRPQQGDWEPVLTATLDSGGESLATLGGVVLKIGEETHGYRLREVRLWEAVFEKNGSNVMLAVEGREGSLEP